jgi:Rrf2 family nitric oxide-sensitive transcriptional repressor
MKLSRGREFARLEASGLHAGTAEWRVFRSPQPVTRARMVRLELSPQAPSLVRVRASGRARPTINRCARAFTSFARETMRLTDYTDYALRVLLYLSVRPAGLSTIQEISDAYGVSKNHLMKIVQQLGELGWVETVRGRNGGLRLADGSNALTIGDIVRRTESDFSIVGCFEERADAEQRCVIQSQCRLRGVLAAARDAFLAELDKHTVGELAGPASELARLLGIPSFAPSPAGSFIRIRASSLNKT